YPCPPSPLTLPLPYVTLPLPPTSPAAPLTYAPSRHDPPPISLSLPSTPGAGTLSGVSSSVLLLSPTATGASLVPVMVMVRVDELVPPLPSVAVWLKPFSTVGPASQPLPPPHPFSTL